MKPLPTVTLQGYFGAKAETAGQAEGTGERGERWAALAPRLGGGWLRGENTAEPEGGGDAGVVHGSQPPSRWARLRKRSCRASVPAKHASKVGR